MATCAVCGMNVDEEHGLKEDFEGKTFYFCSGMCQMKFHQQKGK